jgi:hypothetical protein
MRAHTHAHVHTHTHTHTHTHKRTPAHVRIQCMLSHTPPSHQLVQGDALPVAVRHRTPVAPHSHLHRRKRRRRRGGDRPRRNQHFTRSWGAWHHTKACRRVAGRPPRPRLLLHRETRSPASANSSPQGAPGSARPSSKSDPGQTQLPPQKASRPVELLESLRPQTCGILRSGLS